MDHRDRCHQVALEAAEWVLRLQDPQVTRSERAEHVRWLRESPLHVSEMLRVSHVYSELTDFPYWDEIAPLDVSSMGAPVLELSGARGPPRKSRSVRSLRFWLYIGALAAGMVILAVALVYCGDFRYRTTIDTGIGERRTVTLVDGSVVGNSPETSLSVRFTQNEE